MSQFTHLELKFAQLWIDRHPKIDLIAQYPFGRFRADFCHLSARVVVECQGGTWVAGLGHSSGKGIQRDCRKFCTLASLGYLIFPLTADMIDEQWIDAIASAIQERLSAKL